MGLVVRVGRSLGGPSPVLTKAQRRQWICTGSRSIAGLLCVIPKPSIFSHLRPGGAAWKTPSLPREATKGAQCPELCSDPNEELTYLLEGPRRGNVEGIQGCWMWMAWSHGRGPEQRDLFFYTILSSPSCLLKYPLSSVPTLVAG